MSTDIAAHGLAATFDETKPEEPFIDPATWRVFVVELSGDEGSDPNATRSGILELLKPVDWYAASFAGTDRIGNAWVWLEIDEWGVKGTAKVLAIKPCPKIKPGAGRLVTMRSVTNYSGMMASVLFKDAAGQADTITGTDGHPVYSIDRCGYVDLGSLEPGERVRTADGWATAESMARWWGREVAHNLEVDGVHRYAVGRVGVVGHNAKAKASCAGKPAKRGPKTDPNAPHNKKIREEAKRLSDEGNTILAGGGEEERAIRTPGGKKSMRRPDILYRTPEGELRGLQVGRKDKAGNPVRREREALNDLNNFSFPRVTTTFVPYN